MVAVMLYVRKENESWAGRDGGKEAEGHHNTRENLRRLGTRGMKCHNNSREENAFVCVLYRMESRWVHANAATLCLEGHSVKVTGRLQSLVLHVRYLHIMSAHFTLLHIFVINK